MRPSKKNKIIIGSLCAILLLMVVGYAAFSSILNIKGTSSISSEWNILITNVTTKNIVGGATNAEDPSWEDLTATFKTNLVSSGDSIEYDITVENRGNLNATLDKITLSDSNNPAIKFTSSGLTEGDSLNAGSNAVLTVKVEYDNSVTTQPEDTEGTFTVTLDYSQKNGTSLPSGPIFDIMGETTAANQLLAKEVTTGDGLYADEYESGRYIFKGNDPDNYITFNNETWRILSVESDGTLKIMKAASIGNMAWDATGTRDSSSNGAGGTYCALGNYGCNAWSVSNNFVNGTKSGTVTKDASLNTYLNTEYYNSLNSEARSLIQTHTWSVGPATYNNTDLAAQIASENSVTWTGNIGLMTVSEFLKSNTNTEQCGNFSLNYSNYSTCKTTNYIVSLVPTSGYLWTISPDASSSFYVLNVSGNSIVFYDVPSNDSRNVSPAVYLASDIHLDGEGTSTNPYRVVS